MRQSAWFAITGLAVVALALGRAPVDAPAWVPLAGAVTVTTSYAFALASRTGGRPWVSGALGLALGLGGVLGMPVVLAAAAVSTAVVAAVLGVMSTTPAARFTGVLRESAVAVVVAAVGALAVAAYDATVSVERVAYLTLGLSLLGAIGLVYRLGAGFHGLGKRGAIMLVSGVALLFVTLAYTEALSRWGSPALIAGSRETLEAVRSSIGAVPRPIQVLLGFPALAWGVYTRARRRQGWWVCVFGVTALAVVTVSLLDAGPSLMEPALEVLYGAVLGLGLGYLVIRADKFFTGARGRRARRLEEAAAHRPEPGRLQPLL